MSYTGQCKLGSMYVKNKTIYMRFFVKFAMLWIFFLAWIIGFGPLL